MEVASHLLCFGCREFVRDCVHCSSCKGIFCRDHLIETLVQSGKCPRCRNAGEAVDNDAIQIIVNQVTQRCNGCQRDVLRSEYLQHSVVCPAMSNTVNSHLLDEIVRLSTRCERLEQMSQRSQHLSPLSTITAQPTSPMVPVMHHPPAPAPAPAPAPYVSPIDTNVTVAEPNQQQHQQQPPPVAQHQPAPAQDAAPAVEAHPTTHQFAPGAHVPEPQAPATVEVVQDQPEEPLRPPVQEEVPMPVPGETMAPPPVEEQFAAVEEPLPAVEPAAPVITSCTKCKQEFVEGEPGRCAHHPGRFVKGIMKWTCCHKSDIDVRPCEESEFHTSPAPVQEAAQSPAEAGQVATEAPAHQQSVPVAFESSQDTKIRCGRCNMFYTENAGEACQFHSGNFIRGIKKWTCCGSKNMDELGCRQEAHYPIHSAPPETDSAPTDIPNQPTRAPTPAADPMPAPVSETVVSQVEVEAVQAPAKAAPVAYAEDNKENENKEQNPPVAFEASSVDYDPKTAIPINSTILLENRCARCGMAFVEGQGTCRHHSGRYVRGIKKWTCCRNPDMQSQGCEELPHSSKVEA